MFRHLVWTSKNSNPRAVTWPRGHFAAAVVDDVDVAAAAVDAVLTLLVL